MVNFHLLILIKNHFLMILKLVIYKYKYIDKPDFRKNDIKISP